MTARHHRANAGVWLRFAALCLLLALPASCGKQPWERLGYPEPGVFDVVEVAPLDDAANPKDNLIPNGNFDDWYAGAPYPTGFLAPGSEGSTQVRRGPAYSGPGIHSVEQSWTRNDAGTGLTRQFHIIVSGLKPLTVYRFEALGISFNNTVAAISAREIKDGRPTGIGWASLVTLAPGKGEAQRISRAFTTANSGNVAFFAHSTAETAFPAQVAWLEWRLTETGETAQAQAQDAGNDSYSPPAIGITSHAPNSTVEVTPGEALVIEGYYWGSGDDDIVCRINGAPSGKVEEYERPELAQMFKGHRYYGGWRIAIPPETLTENCKITVQYLTAETALEAHSGAASPESKAEESGN